MVFLFSTFSAKSQLNVSTNRSVQDLIQNVLASKGVVINPGTIFSSSNKAAIGFFDGRNSNLGLDSGIILSTGKVVNAPGPNFLGNTGTSNNQPGDADITTLNPSEPNFDATWISFSFIPESDSVSFRFVFASEEYPEFVNQTYNDVFGLFISGDGYPQRTNLAIIPGTTTPVSIQSINHLTNSTFYRDNLGGNSISFDGFTTILTASAKVTPCTPYELKFVIADIKDLIYDSGIFIEGLSLKSVSENGVSISSTKDIMTECDSNKINFVRNSDDLSNPLVVDFELRGTAKLNTDYTFTNANQVTIPAGAKSVSISISPNLDGIAEPSESIILKITNPVICDTLRKIITLVDYRKFDSVEFKITCADSAAVVAIKDYELLDSIGWYYNSVLISMGPVATLYRLDSGYHYIRAVEKCTGRVIIDSLKIKYYDISVIADTLICYGDTVVLKATSNFPGAKFEWSFSQEGQFVTSQLFHTTTLIPDTSGYVSVKITNDQVCGSYLFKLDVVKLGIGSDTVRVCGLGAEAKLKARGGKHYKWIPNLYLDNDTIAEPLCIPQNNINYKIAISNGSCFDTFDVAVIVDTVIKIKASEDIYVCTRQFADLNAEGSPEGTYIWSPVKGLDNPYSKTPKANPISTTTYYVVGYNGSCSDVDSITVHVIAPVETNLSYSFDSCQRIFIGSQIDATDSTDVLWDMGNGDTVRGPSVYYKYEESGSFVVKSVLNQLAPCIDSEFVSIYLPAVDIAKRRIPQAFSPNGDGVNDNFEIYFGNLTCAVTEFKIFNRWGQLVYDHKMYDTLSWDGTFNGEKCPTGTYVYYLKGDGFEDTGWFALMK